MKTNVSSVVNSLRYLVDGAGDGYFKANPDVRALVSTDEAWIGAHRNIVSQGIATSLFEACDTAGLPRVALPAEFMAAAIVLMCKEVNWMLACHWIGDLHSLSVLMNADEAMYDSVPATELFALCLAVGKEFSDGGFADLWKARFEARILVADAVSTG